MVTLLSLHMYMTLPFGSNNEDCAHEQKENWLFFYMASCVLSHLWVLSLICSRETKLVSLLQAMDIQHLGFAAVYSSSGKNQPVFYYCQCR